MVDYKEVFKNPLLAEVVFEARFPILLRIPRDIADFQETILEKFPETNIIYDKKFFLNSKDHSEELAEKSWEFLNLQNKTKCQVYNHRLSLFSNEYKSWEKQKSEEGFVDILKYCLDNFLEVFKIKKFNRLGLRYINKIKFETKTSEWFKKYFVPIFDIDKYSIEELSQNSVRLRVGKKDSIELTIMSGFLKEKDSYLYLLDFDAFSLNIKRENLYEKLVKLLNVILKEFHLLITEECRKNMRGEI